MSYFSRAFCLLRKKAGFALAFYVGRSSPTATKPRLLCYGAVAFLWERERITNQEVIRQLKEYEVRVSHRNRTTNSPVPEPDPLQDSIPFQSQDDKLAAEKLARKVLFKQRLLEFHEAHSQKHLSRLPVVGLTSSSRVAKMVQSFHYLVGPLVNSVEEYFPSSCDSFCAFSDGAFLSGRFELSVDDSATVSSAVFEPECEFEPSNHITQPVLIDQSQSSVPDFIPTPIEQETKEIYHPTIKQLTPHTPRNNSQSFVINSLPSFYCLAKSFDHFVGQDAMTDNNLKVLASFAGKKLVLRVLDNLEELMVKERRKIEPKPLNKEPVEISGQTCFSGLPNLVPSFGAVMTDTAVRYVDVEVWSSLSLWNGNMGIELHDDVTNASVEDEGMAGWEHVASEKHCTAYRKPHLSDGLYQYKVIGHYDDITARDFLDVQVDHEARKDWDAFAVTLATVDSDPCTGTDIIHWVMKYPFPLSSREYVFARRSWLSEKDNAIVLMNRSVEYPSLPESRKYVRVRDYYSTTVIKPTTSLDEFGFDFELTYFDDPQLVLPSSCVNWVASTAMPDFLDKVHKAALSRQHQRSPSHLLKPKTLYS